MLACALAVLALVAGACDLGFTDGRGDCAPATDVSFEGVLYESAPLDLPGVRPVEMLGIGDLRDCQLEQVSSMEVFRLAGIDPSVAVAARWPENSRVSPGTVGSFVAKGLCSWHLSSERPGSEQVSSWVSGCVETANRALKPEPAVAGTVPLPIVVSTLSSLFDRSGTRPPLFALALGYDSGRGCLTLNGVPAIWPLGTQASANPVAVTLPNGTTAVPGDGLIAAGGYVPAITNRTDLQAASSHYEVEGNLDHLEHCTDERDRVFLFNPEVPIEVIPASTLKP